MPSEEEVDRRLTEICDEVKELRGDIAQLLNGSDLTDGLIGRMAKVETRQDILAKALVCVVALCCAALIAGSVLVVWLPR